MTKFDRIEAARQAREATEPPRPSYPLGIRPKTPADLEEDADVILAKAGDDEEPEMVDIPRRELKQALKNKRIVSYGVHPTESWRFKERARRQ